MKPLATLLLALCAAAAAGCRSNAPRDPRAEEEVLALLAAQQAAWNAGEVERFVELGYWRSPALTFFSGGAITQGYEPLVERYRERYLESAEGMGRLEFSDLEAFALGPDAAMARGRWRLERDGAAPAGGLFTLVLRRVDGAWRIVHDHTSVDETLE